MTSPAYKEVNEYKGLAGWLIVVGIGVVLAPFMVVFVFATEYVPLFEDGIIDTFEYLEPSLGGLVLVELNFHGLLFFASIFLIYLYFSKHYLFPDFYIAITLLAVIFVPVDAWLYWLVFPDEPFFDLETARDFARSLLGAMIWIPYMLVSKRVKATFVEHRPQQATANR